VPQSLALQLRLPLWWAPELQVPQLLAPPVRKGMLERELYHRGLKELVLELAQQLEPLDRTGYPSLAPVLEVPLFHKGLKELALALAQLLARQVHKGFLAWELEWELALVAAHRVWLSR